MSNIQRASGTDRQIVAPSTLVSGTPILIGGNLFGVPMIDAASGAVATIQMAGKHALPKVGGTAAFTLGAKVYWNQSTSKATAVATDAYIGVCTEAALIGDTVVCTDITGISLDPVDADAIAAAFSGTYAGFMHRTSGTALTVKKSNLAAVVAPAVTDDLDLDYSAASLWLDTALGQFFAAVSVADGAAAWRPLNARQSVKAIIPGLYIAAAATTNRTANPLWTNNTGRSVKIHNISFRQVGALVFDTDVNNTYAISFAKTGAVDVVAAVTYDASPVLPVLNAIQAATVITAADANILANGNQLFATASCVIAGAGTMPFIEVEIHYEVL